MKFVEVAQAFDVIEKESGRLKMTQLLADLLKYATPSESVIISYMSLGDLNPVYVGTKFNFAEKSMVKVLAKFLNKSESTIKSAASKFGDLGKVVAEYEWKNQEDLTIHKIDKALHDFEEIGGTGAQEKKEKVLLDLLGHLDSLSAKYVVRIIIGKLRLGFSDMTLLDAFSWMEVGDKSIRKELETAYNVCADIGFIIKTLKEDGLKAIEKMSIEPGIPLRLAAAERLPDAKAIIKKMGECVAQPKLDGFRLQIHIDKRKSKPVVKFFSRNLQDMSEMFPDLRKAVLDLNVKTLVAEGEAIAYEAQTQTFLPFQETVKRKRKYDIEEMAKEFPLKLYLFDLLFLNGKSLLQETHEHRRKELLSFFKSKKMQTHEIVVPIEEEKIKESKDLEKYFKENVSLGLEGLVVKKPDAVYQAGKRNFNWVKLKREESGELNDTIDCVILGYYSGRGKRASFGIGALLVGVFNKKKDIFQTVAKIGTGLTDDEWKDLKKRCDKLKVVNRPKNVECAKEIYPNVWVFPEMVCMIRADEITLSPRHQAGATDEHLGMALRFPRFMGYREDKSAEDATTVKELNEMYLMQYKDKKKKGSGKTKKKSKTKIHVMSIF